MITNFFDFEIRPHWTYTDAGPFVYFAWEDFKLIRSSDAFAHKYRLYKHALLRGTHGIEIRPEEFWNLLLSPTSGLKRFFEDEHNAFVRCPYRCDDDPADIEGPSCGECGGLGSVRKRTYTHIDYWTKRRA